MTKVLDRGMSMNDIYMDFQKELGKVNLRSWPSDKRQRIGIMGKALN